MTVSQNDVVEVTARAEFKGVEDVVNVFQFQLTSATPLSDYTAILQLSNYIDGVYTSALGYQSADFLYRDIGFRNLTTGLLMANTTWPTITAGTGPISNSPPGLAGVINMASSVAKVILRKYLGGIVSTLIDTDGTWAASVQSLLLTIGANLIAGYATGGDVWAYGHSSPKTGTFVVPVGATATDIPGYQRRRKQGRGV